MYFRIGIISWLAGVLSAAAADRGWPQFRGPEGTGVFECGGLPLELGPEKLELQWKSSLGGGYAGVTAAGGRAFTMDRPSDGEERIVCFDVESENVVWERRYPADYGDLDYDSGPRASVTIHDGLAYALGAVGHVHCVDAATGEVRWMIDTAAELGAKRPTWGFAAAPVIRGESVILHLGLPDGSFAAFDRMSGSLRWRGSSDPAGYATPAVISHAGEDVMIGWTPKHIQGLDPDSGEVFWSIPYEMKYGVSIAKPIVRDGIALVCGYWHGSKAIRLDPATPRKASLLWEDEENLRGLMAQPLERDGFVYLLDRSNGLTCFRLESGEKLWDDADRHQVTPADRNPQATMVWVDDGDPRAEPGAGRILSLNANGELLSISVSPEGFTIHSRAQICGKTWAHPAYAGKLVIARTDSDILAWRLP